MFRNFRKLSIDSEKISSIYYQEILLLGAKKYMLPNLSICWIKIYRCVYKSKVGYQERNRTFIFLDFLAKKKNGSYSPLFLYKHNFLFGSL